LFCQSLLQLCLWVVEIRTKTPQLILLALMIRASENGDLPNFFAGKFLRFSVLKPLADR